MSHGPSTKGADFLGQPASSRSMSALGLAAIYLALPTQGCLRTGKNGSALNAGGTASSRAPTMDKTFSYIVPLTPSEILGSKYCYHFTDGKKRVSGSQS